MMRWFVAILFALGALIRPAVAVEVTAAILRVDHPSILFETSIRLSSGSRR